MRVAICGKEWNRNCSFFCRQCTYKVFMCFEYCLPFHRNLKIPVYAVLIQGIFICGFGTGAPGPNWSRT
jgi:hypothetical protein